jgi:hypothetical protein
VDSGLGSHRRPRAPAANRASSHARGASTALPRGSTGFIEGALATRGLRRCGTEGTPEKPHVYGGVSLVNLGSQELPDPLRGLGGLGRAEQDLVDVRQSLADLEGDIDAGFGCGLG